MMGGLIYAVYQFLLVASAATYPTLVYIAEITDSDCLRAGISAGMLIYVLANNGYFLFTVGL